MMNSISGQTAVYAILADPIHHVRTPQEINRLLALHGQDGVMVPLHVASSDLSTMVAAMRGMRNLRGFVATVPHKSAMVALCDSVSEMAARVGAVNVVCRMPDGRLHGEILDGLGFVQGLRAAGIEPAGLTMYLVGSGGAASAIAFALADAGVAALTIANRTRAKAADLAQRIASHYPSLRVEVGSSDPSGHDVVINGTSLGLAEGDALPCDASRLEASQIVAEIIMQPRITPLLAVARERGCRIHEGLPMLTSQAELMLTAMDAGVDRSRAASVSDGR